MIDILFSIFQAIYNGVVTLLNIITSIPGMVDKIRVLFITIFPVAYGYGLVVGSACLAIMFVSILIAIKRLII